ncbi:MAG TPA: oligosaccharide flippase family protein [Candidatus Acidoferrales bacterium]|nr:oligosaccharide flippase family protein [Candidatus Acidoferrales bacterium]
MPEASAAVPSTAHHQRRFVTNVLWSWSGVAASLFQGIIITRIVIRRLGAEHYGIWALIFSILDYFWFFDLGLNTAVTNFCARFLALKDHRKINETISTALFYFSIIGLVICCLAPAVAIYGPRFFRVNERDRGEFSTLILMTCISWGLCIMVHMFVSALDGFQRFDLTSRVMVLQIVLRSAGYFVALQTGHGLVMMAEVFIATQILGYALNFLNFRRVFPELRISPALVSLAMFRDILRYGIKSFVASGSTLVLQQGGPLMIGHSLGEAAVGFYGLPSKLLLQAIDAVSRIGIVTRSSAAELSVTGRRESVIALGVYSNRYSLTLFMPLACFMLVWGRALILRWVGPQMADNSGPLLPIFLLSYALVLAAQFNSSSLLFGVGSHGGYARGLVMEAVGYIGALAVVVPRYGIVGAAWVSAILMIAVRGIYTPWLVSRALDTPFVSYMRGIYVRPLLAGVPVLALGWALKKSLLPGQTWPELIAAGTITGGCYAAIAAFACIAPQHRALFFSRIPVLGPRLVPNRA